MKDVAMWSVLLPHPPAVISGPVLGIQRVEDARGGRCGRRLMFGDCGILVLGNDGPDDLAPDDAQGAPDVG
jgi:hypothetical protein